MELENIIWLVMVIIFMVGSWVANTIRQRQEQKQAEEISRARERQRQSGAGSAGQAERTRLDELAERRRRQLEELAARHGGGAAPPTQRETSAPVNLTARDQAERQRAREQYAARAEALRRQEAAQQQQRQRAERERLARVRAERERQIAAARREQQRVEQQRRTGKGNAVPMRPAQRSAASVQATEQQITARPSVYGERVTDSAMRLSTSDFDRKALRRAIIMKEILDSPLALRESHL